MDYLILAKAIGLGLLIVFGGGAIFWGWLYLCLEILADKGGEILFAAPLLLALAGVIAWGFYSIWTY